MRYHLARDFSKLYILDLGGNVRKNPKLSGTTHNVFGIQVGVSISLLVKRQHESKQAGEILYAKTPPEWRRGQKYRQLDEWKHLNQPDWKSITPDAINTWLSEDEQDDFAALMPLGIKADKGESDVQSLFRLFSLGLATNRDAWAYNFDSHELTSNLAKTATTFEEEKVRYARLTPEARKKFKPRVDETHIKWTDHSSKL